MRLSLETNFPLQFRIAFAKNFSFRFVSFRFFRNFELSLSAAAISPRNARYAYAALTLIIRHV